MAKQDYWTAVNSRNGKGCGHRHAKYSLAEKCSVKNGWSWRDTDGSVVSEVNHHRTTTIARIGGSHV
jgi:hypothetical protein